MTQNRQFRIERIFHPTQYTPSLDLSVRFFERFFARKSDLAETVLKKVIPPGVDYPTDYCAFTSIRDVFFDSLVPEKFVLGGVQVFPSVETPTLRTVGWYAEGLGAIYEMLTGNGFSIWDSKGDPMKTFQAESAVPGGKPMFFTSPGETGLRYQFFEAGPFFFDARSEPGWVLPPVEPDCPFGLEFCAHHTVLTDKPDRALKLLVDLLGGTIIDRGRDEALQATSTYVALADAVFEFATPDEGTPAFAALAAQAPLDAYYSLTWKVDDLDKVERHLARIGVGIQARTGDTIITDPRDGNGIPWGFTTALRKGDRRTCDGA
jgi:hypothetical protein